jgi:hypothetical protein
MELTTGQLLLLMLASFGWGFGAILQWRNIRHQEEIVAGLQRLRLRTSCRAARVKGPSLQEFALPRDAYKHIESPLAGS